MRTKASAINILAANVALYFSITESFTSQSSVLRIFSTYSINDGSIDHHSTRSRSHEHIFPIISEKKSDYSEDALKCAKHLNRIETFSRVMSKRRTFLSASTALLAPNILGAQDSNAAQGAAEYDLEYYVRDLISGNKKEGAMGASKPPKLPPPRRLDEALASRILNNLVIQCLNEYAPSVENIQEKIDMYKSKSKPAFQTKLNWLQDDVTDQYYFDFLSYATWRASSDLIPNFINREKYVRSIGRTIWKDLQSDYLNNRNKSDGTVGMLSTIASSKLTYVLDRFQGANFLKEYTFSSDSLPKSNKQIIFDSYDDKDFMDGNTLNFLISIISPPTLYSSLQITAEGSRFAPEFIGTTLAAALEDDGTMKAQYETYFVDREYRPNPKDYFPDEQLLQFTIVKS